MELQEFIRLKPSDIRRDNNLMQLFVKHYEAAFLVKPSCAGCVFKSGFERLKSHALKNDSKQIKQIVMLQKTFKLKTKFRTKILTYKEGGKTYRKYGHALDEDFAVKLVEHGKSDVFDVTPIIDGIVSLDSGGGSVGDSKEFDSKIQTDTLRKTINSINTVLDVTDLIDNQSKKADDILLKINKYKEADYREVVLPKYAEVKEATGLKAESNKKDDIISFIIEHES